MGGVSTVGFDIANSVFQAQGGRRGGVVVVVRRRLRRDGVVSFFAGLAPCRMAMEACGSAHYWARELR